MSATLAAISGLGGKSPACFLVEANGARLFLDLGYGPQPGLWPDVSRGWAPWMPLLLSHGHRDHAGGLTLLPQIGNPPVYATDSVRRQSCRARTKTISLPLHGNTEVCGIRIATGRSGHAPGGIWLYLVSAGQGSWTRAM